MRSVISNLNFRRPIEYIREKLKTKYILVGADEIYIDLYGTEVIMNPNGERVETPIISKNVSASKIFDDLKVPEEHQFIAVKINPFIQPSELTTNIALKNCKIYLSPEGKKFFKAGVMRELFFHPGINRKADPSLDTRIKIKTDYILHDREELLATFDKMSEEEREAYLTAVYNVFENPHYKKDKVIEPSEKMHELMKRRVLAPKKKETKR